MAESALGPQRLRPASAAGGRAEKEKRKRSRVTPEQLVHLERFFATDRSPTAARRKEISDMLGMQERQTQIWFQNRRAKAKLQDGKKGGGSSAETPPDTPPQLVTGYQAELHSLLHEDEPVTIISCTDLSVGTWRRIATSSGQHDLVAYLSDTKRRLTWFIHTSGFGFKMEIPFDIIIKTEFSNAAPGSGLASFFLSRPPTFYLETPPLSNPGQGTEPGRHWKKCADWTEDQQATKVLRHDLVGSAVQLAHVLRHLNAHTSGSDVLLRSPAYHSQELSQPSFEIQPPPPAIFSNAAYHYHPSDSVGACQPDHPILTHKRSFSPVASQQLPLCDESLHLPIEQPTSSVIPERNAPIHSHYPRHPTVEVDQTISYSDHSETTLPHNISHSSLPSDCGSSRTLSSSGSHGRPYSAGSVHSLPYENDTRVFSFPDSLQLHRSDAPAPFEPPSPPLLTIPFYPAGSAADTNTLSTYDPGISLIPGIPGMSISDDNT